MTSATAAVRGQRGGALVAVTAVAAALVLGVAVAVDARLGIALVLLAVFVPLIVADPPLGVAILITLESLSALAGIDLAIAAMTPLLLLGAAGAHAARTRLGDRAGSSPWHALFAAMLAWSVLSLAWAAEPGAAKELLSEWARTAAVVLVIAVTVRTRRDVRVVLWGLILGPVLSVAVGLAGVPVAALDAATEESLEGRLIGGVGDPNFLAAGIVPAIVLAVGMCAGSRRARWPVAVAIGLLCVGLAATQSRGGALAALVAWTVALVVMRGRRAPVLLAGIAVVALAGVNLAANPAAVERFTSNEDEGSGRTELWTVAGRVLADHPVVGVGLDNFRVHSPEYVRRPGSMRFVELIADRPHVVHNTYLEALTETGVVGVALLLSVLAVGARSAWTAGRFFERHGDRPSAVLSDAVFVAALAVMTAGVFLSYRAYPYLWVLLSLAVALAAIARARAVE